jgi:hypothetical protein
LINSKFIDLNHLTGEAHQLRDYKTGKDLEKPLLIPQIKQGGDYYLEVKVWGRSMETRIVRVKAHKLIYDIAVKSNMKSDEWARHSQGKEIHHKDGNHANNRISDLEMLTPEEHREKGKQTGAHKQPKSEYSKDDLVVAEVFQLHTEGLPSRKIGEKTGVHYKTCQRMIAGTYRYRESTDDPMSPACQSEIEVPEKRSSDMADSDIDDDDIDHEESDDDSIPEGIR